MRRLNVDTSTSDLNKPQFLIIEDIDDRKVVNVDMSTSQGQARAKDLNLAES